MSSTLVSGDGSTASTDADTTAAESPADTTAGDAPAAIGIDVPDVRTTQDGYAVEYWAAVTEEDSVREEVTALIGSYLTAIDEGCEPQRSDATLVRNAGPAGTWHIRDAWIHQLADGDMSPDAFGQLVFETITWMD